MSHDPARLIGAPGLPGSEDRVEWYRGRAALRLPLFGAGEAAPPADEPPGRNKGPRKRKEPVTHDGT